MSNEFKPYVSADKNLKEFTVRALLIGLFLAVLLGAANAYLGLKAGMTIAATYPAAVLGMALLRLFKDHNIIEENFTRTVGSIGESVAAGAIFTLPAFLIAGVWKPGILRQLRRLSEVHRHHDGRRHRGHPVRHPAAPGHGRGPRTEVPRIGRGLRDPQGRPRRRHRRQVPVLRHGHRRLDRTAQGLQPAGREVGEIQRLRLQDHPAHRHRRELQGRRHRRRLPVQDARPSAPPSWAWATSSARAWRP